MASLNAVSNRRWNGSSAKASIEALALWSTSGDSGPLRIKNSQLHVGFCMIEGTWRWGRDTKAGRVSTAS